MQQTCDTIEGEKMTTRANFTKFFPKKISTYIVLVFIARQYSTSLYIKIHCHKVKLV